MKYKKISIVGCGNVGAELFFLLMHYDQPLHINIIEPDANREGAILDILHIQGSVRKHNIEFNNLEFIQESDFIFLAAGKCNAPGESRMQVVEENVKLIQSIFKNLQVKENAFIIVITNPVDVIATALKFLFHDRNINVAGTGTYLDTMRFNYYISKELNCDINGVEGWIFGEHGNSMVPVFSKTFIKGKSIMDIAYLKQLDTIAVNTIQAATHIRKTQSGTWYGVAHCSFQIMKNIIDKYEGIYSLSVKTDDYFKKYLNLDEDIFIGLPCRILNNKIQPASDFTFNSMETEMLQNSASVIKSYTKNINKWLNE